jgi:hypothetical protein
MSKRASSASDAAAATAASKDRKVTLTEESIRIRYGIEATRTPDTPLASDFDARFVSWRAASRQLVESDNPNSGESSELAPLALATLWFSLGDDAIPNVICPVTQLHESMRASCPWVWAASLDAWIDANFGRLRDSAPLCAMLKRELRDAIVIQTAGDNAWVMAYVLRARVAEDGDDDDGEAEPAEPFWHSVGARGVHSVAFGSAPASEAEIDSAARKLKEQHDWTFDATLVQFWRLLHARFWPAYAASGGVFTAQDGGLDHATLAPGSVNLKSDVDPDVFDDIEAARPEDIQMLQEDMGEAFYVMWRTDKKTNRQIVVNWDHEEPGAQRRTRRSARSSTGCAWPDSTSSV